MNRRCAVLIALVIAPAITGCKQHAAPRIKPDDARVVIDIDARAMAAQPDVFASLAEFPSTTPRLEITLPVAASSADRPLMTVAGPSLLGELAIVASSRLGFVAVDRNTGKTAWQRSAGLHVAPPLARSESVLLISDCEHPGLVADTDRVLGCYRIVTEAGADLSAGAIVGDRTATAAFADATGTMQLIEPADNIDGVIWQRGEQAVHVTLGDGRATPIAAPRHEVIARKGDRAWHIALDGEALVALDDGGKPAWHVDVRFAAVLGIIPGRSYEVPMVRVAHLNGVSGIGHVELLDIDATGSKRGQAAFPMPGIALLGHDFAAANGNTVLAVRMDSSLQHDFIVGYDGHSTVLWTWHLPVIARPDPVGVAIANDGVVVFHDGDRLTVLPPLSQSPTAVP